MASGSGRVVREAFSIVLEQAGWPPARVAAFDRAVVDLDRIQTRHADLSPRPGSPDAWRLERARCRLVRLMALFDEPQAGGNR